MKAPPRHRPGPRLRGDARSRPAPGGAAGCVMGCHALSCFPCRAVMRYSRSRHNAVGSGPASGFFLRAFRLGVRGMAFLLSAPISFHSPAGVGTLNSRVMRAGARAGGRAFGAGAVCAPDCPGAPPRASRTQGAGLPPAPRGSLRAGATAGGLRMTPAAPYLAASGPDVKSIRELFQHFRTIPVSHPGAPSRPPSLPDSHISGDLELRGLSGAETGASGPKSATDTRRNEMFACGRTPIRGLSAT